uniref:BapA prefix-like domain-containing protein n=1 Tax=Burkholderia pyrrocinia TaxID=60550 RepID=UPI002AB0FF91
MDKRIDVKVHSGAVETHTVPQNTQDTTILVRGDTEVRLFSAQGDIVSMERHGEDLIIKYADGTTVRLQDYFDCPVDAIPSLVLDSPADAGHAEQLYKADLDPAACFAADDASGGPVAYTWAPMAAEGSSLLTPLLVLGGLAAAGGVAALAAGGGGGSNGSGSGGAPASPGGSAPGSSASQHD